MKRVFLFALLGSAGVLGLLHLAGGLDGPAADRPDPAAPLAEAAHTPVPTATDRHIRVGTLGGPSVRTPGGAHARMLSKARTLAWTDPATGDVLEIRGWFNWSFKTAEFKGLPRGDAATQGILCKDVVLELYREPLTRSEAMRRQAGELRPVLRQRFTATRARAFGSIAQNLNDKTGKREAKPTRDTRIVLLGDVVITDFSEGLTVTGSKLEVFPVQERVEGVGPFKVVHEALTLTGTDLAMERHERGWTRVEIQKDTSLDLHTSVRDERGRPMFDFGTGEFRPTQVHSKGRAIFVREQGRREQRLRLTFPDGVHAVQEGGRQLEANWLEMLALQDEQKIRDDTAPARPWTLRDLRAEGDVRVEYRDVATNKQPFLTSIRTERLVHLVPRTGRSRTELDGRPRIVVRGQLGVETAGDPNDRLHITCRDRAWIEPLTSAEVDPNLDVSRMQRMALRGGARIERHAHGPDGSEDVLEGESVDLLMLEEVLPTGGSHTVAVQFSATGDVRLGGTRIRGRTPKLLARRLNTEQPHIYAEGPGTTFTLLLLQRDQGLLGPDQPDPSPGPAPRPPPRRRLDAPATAPTTTEEPTDDVEWTLRRMHARGRVRVETQMFGASVGIPTRVTAHEASYDEEQRLARLNGRPSAPARIVSTAAPDETNVMEAQTMTLDRARGIITARHAVRGELYMGEGGGLGGLGDKRKPTQAREMTVRTDMRIDVHLMREATRYRPQIGREQRISVQGPLVTELKSENLTVDRMHADQLDVVLAARVPRPKVDATTASAPTARPAQPVGDHPTSSRDASPARAKRSRTDVRANDVRIHLLEGAVHRLDAFGGVDVKGEAGHVTGERITYSATTHRVDVLAGPDVLRRPARALLGRTESRTEIAGARLGLVWRDGQAHAADATAPDGRKARILLFREDPKAPHLLERYELRYQGTVHLLPHHLTATNVIVIRSVRNRHTQALAPPSTLYTPNLRVTGSNLLSREAVTIDRMTARGPKTYFRSTAGGKLLEGWGPRFEYNVVTGVARLIGTPGNEVALKYDGHTNHSPTLLIDVKKGLPYLPDGTSLVLKNR